MRLKERPLLRALWRYRVVIAGISALALAVAGEALMRGAPGQAGQSSAIEIGSRLVQAAVLLVALVAWVRDDLPRFGLGRKPKHPSIAPEEIVSGKGDDIVEPTSRASGIDEPLATHKGWLSALARGYTEVRSRLGWRGTAFGLIVVALLALWLLLLLRDAFANPGAPSLAPWVWLAMLVALALTFIGVRPWPKGDTLITHDPAEPAAEPPVSRWEWLLVAGIMLAAIALRFWNLESIPAGPYIDESGRALDARALNRGDLVNREPFTFFGTGWWGVPSFYFWLVAQSMKLFGDSLLGARVVHAIAGVLTVWYTYRIGRIAWSPRAGLLAAALLTISDFAIQFSRTAGESTITIFTCAVSFYYLYKALKTRRPLDFVLSGLAAGFTLYGYASGKLLVPLMVLIAVYLLARWGSAGIKRYLPGLALVALAAGLTIGPNALFIFTQKPAALTERSSGVSIFAPNNQQAAFAAYGTDNMGVVLARQFATTYAAFDVGQERGPFYPTNRPLLPVPWAGLWILGTAYMLWRLGDARYGVLALWLVGGLAGAALTNDAPTIQRTALMVPTLGLFPALYLDRLASGLLSLRPGAARPRSVRVLKLGTSAALGALVLFTAAQTLPFYFGPYTARAMYSEFTLAGDYAGKLDPRRNVVYTLNTPVMFGDPSPLQFLSKGMPLREFANASNELPVTNNEGKVVHFLISPPEDPAVGLIQSYYPDAVRTIISKPDGTPVLSAVRVTADQIEAQQRMAARYGPPEGPIFEQREARLGTLTPSGGEGQIGPPAWITYPTTAEWAGGLVAPVYGAYRLRIDAPAGATLKIDGRPVLTATAGVGTAEAQLVMAQGAHRVSLAGRLDDPRSRIELRWGTGSGELVPVAKRFLWGGPQGTLLAETYPGNPDPALLTVESLPPVSAPPTSRRDGSISLRNVNEALRGGTFSSGVWRGTLRAPVAGDYVFDTATQGQVAFWLDGRLAGAANVPAPSGLPLTVRLEAGEHPFEVRFATQRDFTELQVFWQPPGGARALIPPSAFTPARGGVWLAEERPSVPAFDPAIISAADKLEVRLVGVAVADSEWSEATGVAALFGAGVAVGDARNQRLLIYGQDGKRVAGWGGKGEADTFNDVSDLAVSNDGLVVALDAENTDIRLFDVGGRPLARLPREAMGLSHARGVAWGQDGKIYVADTGGSRVVRITREGQVEATFREGNGPILALDQPIDVVTTPDGSIYTVDVRGRIVRYNVAGQADREWRVPFGVQRGGSKLALWGEKIVMTNPDSGVLLALDIAAGVIQTLNVTGDTPLNLNIPTGIAAAPDGRLYVLDSGNNRVVVLEKAP